jgi:hypothetical protein
MKSLKLLFSFKRRLIKKRYENIKTAKVKIKVSGDCIGCDTCVYCTANYNT